MNPDFGGTEHLTQVARHKKICTGIALAAFAVAVVTFCFLHWGPELSESAQLFAVFLLASSVMLVVVVSLSYVMIRLELWSGLKLKKMLDQRLEQRKEERKTNPQ